jgi:hypothetical protein
MYCVKNIRVMRVGPLCRMVLDYSKQIIRVCMGSLSKFLCFHHKPHMLLFLSCIQDHFSQMSYSSAMKMEATGSSIS